MKKIIEKLFVRHDAFLILLVAASFCALSFAYVAQYGFNLQPCVLCLYQRVPYAAVIIAGGLMLAVQRKYPKAVFYGLLIAFVSFAAGVGLSFFHTGVEQGWWQGTAACGGGTLPIGATLDELREYINNRPIVRCDVPAWTLFGVSMTGYNLMLSLLLLAVTICGLKRAYASSSVSQ